MKLTDEQKQTISDWVEQGLGLSEIQRKLDEELGLNLTFMETRFLVDDLNLNLVEKKAPAPPEGTPAEGSSPAADAPVVDAEVMGDGAGVAGGVTVSLDRLTTPGAVVSGSVTFSDGTDSTWSLDQYGRIMLKAAETGYKPSAEDLQAFQTELSRQLERQGY